MIRKSTGTNTQGVNLKRIKPNEDEVDAIFLNRFFNTKLVNCTCSALSQNGNLILLYGLKRLGRDYRNTRYYRCACTGGYHGLDSEGYCLTIFTIEGYYVTSKMHYSFKNDVVANCAFFSDHLINLSFKYKKLLTFNDYATELQNYPPLTDFACFHENGDIYSNSGRSAIIVFSPELKFKKRLRFNLTNHASIEFFIIKRDTINLLTHKRHSGNKTSDYVVHIYRLSDFLYFESIEFVQSSFLGINDICIDEFKNIIVNDSTAIVVLPYRGTFHSIQFGYTHECNCIHLTEDSQLIRVMYHGQVKIFQIVI